MRTFTTASAGWLAIFFLFMTTGCGRTEPEPQAPQSPHSANVAGDDSGDHDHHGAGPHGGVLAEWDDYHVEFTVDHPKQHATVYILASDAKSPAPIESKSVLLHLSDASVRLDLAPQPLPDDPAGKSSRFTGQHQALGTVREFAGSLGAVIAGTPYAADFSEVAN